MKSISDEQLKEVLRLHRLWLEYNPTGVRADLSDTDLSYRDLSGIDLTSAILERADLTQANLTGTNLEYAFLDKANFTKSNLSKVNLTRCFDKDTANFKDCILDIISLLTM